MRKKSLLVTLLLVCIFSLVFIDRVKAEIRQDQSWKEWGESSDFTFQTCSYWNGCIGVAGYQYTIGTKSGDTFTRIPNSHIYKDSSFRGDWDTLVDKVKNNKDLLFSRILEYTGVSETDFFTKDYYIKVEPIFYIVYDLNNLRNTNANLCSQNNPCTNEDRYVGTAKEVAKVIHDFDITRWASRVANPRITGRLNGLARVPITLPCTVYIPNDETNDFCNADPNAAYSNRYLSAVNSSISVDSKGYIALVGTSYYNANYAVGLIKADQITREEDETGSLKIIKKDKNSEDPIQGIRFYLDGYSDKYYCTTNWNGECTISDIPFGTYALKEDYVTAQEKGYSPDYHSYVIIFYSTNKYITRTIYNTKGCASDFELYKNNKSERIRMYEEYKAKGFNYTGLLDFTNTTDSSKACSVASCDYSSTGTCLAGSSGDLTFNSDNISCYNETYDINGGKTAYCLTTFKLQSKLGGGSFFAKAGQMFIQRSTLGEAVIATGTITKKCFIVSGTSYASSIGNTNYKSYVSNIQFNEIFLSVLKNNMLTSYSSLVDTDTSFSMEYNSSTGLYEGSKSIDYYAEEVYAYNKTGEISSTKCTNCKFLGYGFISKFNSSGTTQIPFQIDFVTNNPAKLSINSYSNTCKYTITPEIVENNELNLEFRSVQSNNPFPGKSGNTRNPGYNWSIVSLSVNGGSTFTVNDYSHIMNNIENYANNPKYDINKDGIFDNKDLEIMKTYVTTGKDLYSTTILQNTPNSYGIIPSTNERVQPKYVITLTPSDIKDIKTYNVTNNYDDYNLTCTDDGNTCTSNYISSLISKKIVRVNNSSKRN